MTTITIVLSLVATIFTLIKLCIIDLKIRLLPNVYVVAFFVCGLIFHTATNFTFTTPMNASIGIIGGGGMLLAIRQIANYFYQKDTLGLGDVKLLGAAGLWLGASDIFLAISLGAFAGLIHGAIYKLYMQRKTGELLPLSTLSIPAGPGFIIGIIIVGVIKFQSLSIFLTS